MRVKDTTNPNTPGRLALRAALTSLLTIGVGAAGCATEEPTVLPDPIAGLLHPEMVKVGQEVLLDARLSVVATLKGGAPAPGAQLVSYRFAVADGSAAVDLTTPTWQHTFSAPGVYAVSLTIADDRGLQSKVTSSIHVQPDFSSSCTNGTTASCASGVCDQGVCSVMACAGPDVCTGAGSGLTCAQGRCVQPAVAP